MSSTFCAPLSMSWNVTSIYDWVLVDCINQKEQQKWNTDLNKDAVIQNPLVMEAAKIYIWIILGKHFVYHQY